MKRSRFLMLLGLILSLVFFAENGYAAQVTLSWTNATKNEDATDIPTTGAAALASTTLKWGACNPDDTPALPLLEATFPTTVPGNAETEMVTIFTPGRWCFIGVHTNQGDPAENIDPQTSADSNPVFKDIIMVPEPPQNLTIVAAALVVYDIVKQNNKYILLAVGTAPPGTPCDGSQQVNGRFAVSTDVVAWFGNVQPPVVVADCS